MPEKSFHENHKQVFNNGPYPSGAPENRKVQAVRRRGTIRLPSHNTSFAGVLHALLQDGGGKAMKNSQ